MVGVPYFNRRNRNYLYEFTVVFWFLVIGFFSNCEDKDWGRLESLVPSYDNSLTSCYDLFFFDSEDKKIRDDRGFFFRSNNVFS